MTMTLLVIFGAIWFWSVLASACLTSPVYDNKIDDLREEYRKKGYVLNLEQYYQGRELYSNPKSIYGDLYGV